MLTLVSVPLPFADNQLTIDHQYNAIKSWALLDPKPEIFLLGKEKGVKDVAESFQIGNIPEIQRNQLGDLSMRSIFRLADKYASNDWICYVDTDIILMSDFWPMFNHLVSRFDQFVSCAGRWDADIPTRIPFYKPDWEIMVRNAVYKKGQRGSDYCIYPKGFYHDMPDFSIGRGHWDGWRMGWPLALGIPLVNVERVCYAVHQKHGHRWSGQKGTGRNKRLMGNVEGWINHATHWVTKEEMKHAKS